MHRARTDSNWPRLGMILGSRAIGHPQPQAEEWKSQLFTLGAMISLSNLQQGPQSAPDLALAKSVRMMPGTALSSWRRNPGRRRRRGWPVVFRSSHSDREVSQRLHAAERHAQVQWLCEAKR